MTILGIMVTVFYSGIDVRSNVTLKILMTIFFGCIIAVNMVLFYAFQKHTENLSENARQKNANVVFDVYVEPGCILSHIQDIDLVAMLGN